MKKRSCGQFSSSEKIRRKERQGHSSEDSSYFPPPRISLSCRDNVQFGGKRNEYKGNVDFSQEKKAISNAQFAHIGDNTINTNSLNIYSNPPSTDETFQSEMELKAQCAREEEHEQYLWNMLRDHLYDKAMEYCGEIDQFRKGKIEIADLQISTELPILEQVQQRSDMAKVFQKHQSDTVPYAKLFEEVEFHVQKIPNKGSTAEAEKKFLNRHGNLVVISGQPGIGKTTLTKRLVHEMWNDSLFNSDIVFFIQFRYLDYEKKIDLFNFLVPMADGFFNIEDQKKLLNKIKTSSNVFIIMDGLDEADIDPKMKQFKPSSADFDSTAEGFIQNLLAGNILPHCKKLITSRP